MINNYEDLETVAKSLNESNDCAVKAVTIVSGLAYQTIHKIFAVYGRQFGKKTYQSTMFEVLKGLEIFVVDVTGNFKSKTVRTLARELPVTGKYLIWTRGHVLVARDGEICDWTKGCTHRILKIMKVSF